MKSKLTGRHGDPARERNWLSWVKLSVTLFVITAALLLRFSFSSHPLPHYEYDAERPVRAASAHRARLG